MDIISPRHFGTKPNIEVALFLNKMVPGNCDFYELTQRYENVSNNSLIIGQIHPAIWIYRNLKEFEKFLCYVLEKGKHQFIIPRKYIERIKQ